MADDIVLYDSDEAAQWTTGLSGWVSRHGHYFGPQPSAEGTARYDGCTHRKCECGALIHKSSARCNVCSKAARDAVFAAMPREKWDGVAALVLFDEDRFFFDEDDLTDYCGDEGIKPSSLRLVLCEPRRAALLGVDHWADDLPEDGEAPVWLENAIEAFNAAVRANGELLSWVQGKKAADVSEWDAAALFPEKPSADMDREAVA